MNLLKKYLREKPAQPYKQLVFTTGYTDRDVRRLPDLLRDLNAVLVDIRFNPTSRKPQWGKDYLKLLLKDKYRHVPSLGNRAGDGAAARDSIQNLNLGIRIIDELKVNVLLMCGCRLEKDCHRRFIAQKLTAAGVEVREIADWNRADGNLSG